MSNVVIVFESRYGQSHAIADFIAERVRREEHTAIAVRASLATQRQLDEADAFVVVAPVYFGRHPRAITDFVRRYAGTLAQRALAFVSVGNAAAHPTANARAHAKDIAYRTIDAGGLLPNVVISVAGALAYPRYGFVLRHVMRLVAWTLGEPTGKRNVHSLTDFGALERELEPFLAVLDIERGASWRAARVAPSAAVV